MLQAMGMQTGRVGWAAETPQLFCGTFGAGWMGLRHHLVVEALPNGGWDWLAWTNDGSGRSLHGRTGSWAEGMVAAEQAAALMARTRRMPMGAFTLN